MPDIPLIPSRAKHAGSERLFAAALGTAAIIIGVAILWLNAAGTREHRARKSWSHTRGKLWEVSLCCPWDATDATRYSLEVRYTFAVNGREYTGSWIDGDASIYGFEVAKQCAAWYVPEAADLSQRELSLRQPCKTWQIPFPGRDVRIKYDPADPRRAVLLAEHLPSPRVASPVVVWGLGLGFILLGALIIATVVAISAVGMRRAANRAGSVERRQPLGA